MRSPPYKKENKTYKYLQRFHTRKSREKGCRKEPDAPGTNLNRPESLLSGLAGITTVLWVLRPSTGPIAGRPFMRRLFLPTTSPGKDGNGDLRRFVSS